MNTNCLQGIRCPNCRSEGPFSILVTAWARVCDDGVDDTTDHVWDAGSAIICVACSTAGTIRHFTHTSEVR